MTRDVRLSLSDAERDHLASLGVVADEHGFLRSASGREIPAGVAASMLTAHPQGSIQPGDFQRGYLRDGHQAEHAQGIGGVPSTAQGAGSRPAAEVGKGVTPGQFQRPYLAPGHQADSPAVPGHQSTEPMPEANPAEPGAFRRGPLRSGHESPSPGDSPANNPHSGGTPAAAVYASASAAYDAGQSRVAAEHLMPSTALTARPAPAQWAPPADLGASSVPVPVTPAATRPAPGERR